MTVVRRRPKPAADEPWPSQAEPAARVTTEGKVSGSPSPIQAMWAEAIGREQDASPRARHEAEGLCVALAILTCATLEEVRDELNRRTRWPHAT